MASATIGSTLLGTMMRAFCPGLIPKPGRCDSPLRGGSEARRRAPGRSCSTSVILGRCLGYRGAGKSNESLESGSQRSSSWILAACPSAAKSPGRRLAPMREAVDVLTNCRLGNVVLCVVDIQCPLVYGLLARFVECAWSDSKPLEMRKQYQRDGHLPLLDIFSLQKNSFSVSIGPL